MMRFRRWRRIFPVLGACAALAVSPVGGGWGQQPAGPEAAAKAWAEDMRRALERVHGGPDERSRMAIQPLHPRDFPALNGRHRRQLYDWLLKAFRDQVGATYTLVDPGQLTNIARVIESSGESDWFQAYKQVLERQKTPVSIVCNGHLSGTRLAVTCSATLIENNNSLGDATGHFEKDWIMKPIALEFAVGEIARDASAQMVEPGELETVRVVDSGGREDTELAKVISRKLEVAIHRQMRAHPGYRSVGRDGGGRGAYRLEAEVHRLGDNLELCVRPHFGKLRLSPLCEEIFLSKELKAWLADASRPSPGDRGEPDPAPAGAGAAASPDGGCGDDPGRRPIGDGWKLRDWVDHLARDRMDSGDYRRVLKEATAHLRDHCNWGPVEKIRDDAVEKLAGRLGESIERDPRAKLKELKRIEELAGPRPSLLLLRAQLHGELGEPDRQAEAYRKWLEATPRNHPERGEVVAARAHALKEHKAAARELALRLDGRSRSLARLGLSSFGHDGGSGPGAFDDAFRVALRSWQDSRKHEPTGWLTPGQRDTLIEEGRAVEARERDDAAFKRARAADTVAAYVAYLKSHPKGRQAAEARRLLEEARKDHAAFARARAADTAAAYAADTAAAYTAYLKSYPNGRHAAEARRRLEAARKDHAEITAFRRAKKLDTSAAYNSYLMSYPNGSFVREAKRLRSRSLDRDAIEKARLANTAQAYRAYLSDNPTGQHRKAAQQHAARLDREEFNVAVRIDTVEAYEKYLSMNQSGAFVEEARDRIRKVLDRGEFERAKARNTIQGYETYLVDNPDGAHRSEALALIKTLREPIVIAEAKSKHTVESYDEYLRSYPNGMHAGEVRRIRNRLYVVGKEFRDCDHCPQMVVVPSGSFTMGTEDGDADEQPPHLVTFAQPFGVGKYEVTVAEYRAFVQATKHDMSAEDGPFGMAGAGSCQSSRFFQAMKEVTWREPGYAQTDASPVVCVNWNDAKAYVKWLSRTIGKSYRLLSEAEWEYVTRANTTGTFYFGNIISTKQANYNSSNSTELSKDREYRAKALKVGSFKANKFGVHDMHGNVLEWVEDCWNLNYEGAPRDGSAWISNGNCSSRVLRGGSWFQTAPYLRSAFRNSAKVKERRTHIGLRIGRTIDPTKLVRQISSPERRWRGRAPTPTRESR